MGYFCTYIFFNRAVPLTYNHHFNFVLKAKICTNVNVSKPGHTRRGLGRSKNRMVKSRADGANKAL
jgi:hypothetical protein